MAGTSEQKPSKEVQQDREVSRRGKDVFGQLTYRSSKVSNASNSDGSSDTKEKKSVEQKSEASTDPALQDSVNFSARSAAPDGINSVKHRLLLDMEVPSSSRQRAEAFLKTLGRLSLGIFKFAVDTKAEPTRIGNEEGLQLAKDRDVFKAQVDDQAGYVQGLVDQAIQKYHEISDKEHQKLMQDLQTHKQVFTIHKNESDEEKQKLKENLEKQKKEQLEIEHRLEQQKESHVRENQKLRQDLERYRQALDTHKESLQAERNYLFERYEEVLSSQEQLQSNFLILQEDSDRLNDTEARKFAVFRRDNHQPPGPEDGSAIAAGNTVAHYGNPIGDVSRLERERNYSTG